MIDMTLEIAETAVRAAQARARELGTPITVTVVDEAGRLVLSARGNGTGFLTPETSRGKAIAAAAFRRSTKEMAETAREHALFWKLPVRPCPRRDHAQHGRRPPSADGSSGRSAAEAPPESRITSARWRARRPSDGAPLRLTARRQAIRGQATMPVPVRQASVGA